MMTTTDPYDVLCDVITDWLEKHKGLTKAKIRYEGVSTPRAARHEYLYDAGLYGGERNGKALYDFFGWVRDPEWPTRVVVESSKARLAFDARVRADRFELLREWVIVSIPGLVTCTQIKNARMCSWPSPARRSGSRTSPSCLRRDGAVPASRRLVSRLDALPRSTAAPSPPPSI
jgi:hypothetical protein